jgi:predicted extracellular nuclease
MNTSSIKFGFFFCFLLFAKASFSQKSAKTKNNTYHDLSASNFSQNWNTISQISTNDDWSGVPSIQGFLGQDLVTTTGANPQNIVVGVSSSTTSDLDVIANQTNTGITNGGVAEFHITDPTIALQGSGTADAPHIILYLNTLNRTNISFKCNLRDLDGSGDNSVQPVAFQYRIGNTGNFTDIPAAYIFDATTGPNIATNVVPIEFTLPVNANNQANVEIRVITANALGNDEWVGIDDIEVSSTGFIGALPALSINDVSLAEGNAGQSNMIFTLSLDNPVTVANTSCVVSTQDNTALATSDYTSNSTTITFPMGSSSATFTVPINGDVLAEANETFFVTVSAPMNISLAKASGTGTITNDDTNNQKISTIQGSTNTSPLANSVVSFTAIVTGDFQNENATDTRLGGFFVQEEDADADADANTSEGIFVYEGNGVTSSNVAVGDLVTVSGTVVEFNGLTEITAPTITIVSSGNTLPAFKTLTITSTDTEKEALESMRISINQTLTITDNYDFGRLGELGLATNGKQQQYTELNAPSVTGFAGYEAAENAKRIILDDDKSGDYRTPIYSWAENVGAGKSYFRAGSTLSSLSGILDYGFSAFRVRPLAPVTFTASNPRPDAPSITGNIKVATMNVLNYFNGPTFPTSRGADNSTEYILQKAKIVKAIQDLNADVIGLQEIENDDFSATGALGELVAALNTALGAGTYDFVNPGTTLLGSDAIKVSFLYKPAKVSLIGAALTLTTPTDLFASNGNRVPLAQKFKAVNTCEEFTVIVNHFKAKSTGGATGLNTDQMDGQAAWAQRRGEMADALINWVNTTIKPNNGPNVIIIGDLNSYEKETPITKLTSGGFTLINAAGGSKSFNGLFGDLDYMLFSNEMASQLKSSAKWAINADECPTLFQYDAMDNIPGTTFDPTADVYSSSDHDPIVAGFSLDTSTLPLTNVSASSTQNLSDQNFTANCALLAKVVSNTAMGNIATEVYVNSTTITQAGKIYGGRYYQLSPAVNGSGTVTLYFTQSEFNTFNAANPVKKLPLNVADAEAYKANLRIAKYAGTVTAPTGPASYSTSEELITPAITDIVFQNNRWEITFPVTSFSGFFLTSNDNNSVLPLQLLQFSGLVTAQNHVKLSWTTAKEENFSGFELQKMNDTAFEKTTWIAGGKSNYHFTDTNPQTGVNSYRLKMIDTNGSYKYSKVVSVFTKAPKLLAIEKIYPNPAIQHTTLNVQAANSGKATLEIIQFNGKTVSSQQVILKEGANQLSLSVNGLNTGTYVVKLKQAYSTASWKLLVK